MDKPKYSFRELIARLGLMVISSAITLVFAELLIGFFKPAPAIYPITITGDGGDYTLASNKKLVYVPKPGTGEFNRFGYRGREYFYERAPGKKRIVFLGDSVLEGLGVNPQERFTELLSSELGSEFEIINLGVQGYNLLQEFEYLKEFGIKYKPDHVIFCITYNDLEMIRGGEIELFQKRMDETGIGRDFKFNNYIQKKLFDINIYRYLFLLDRSIKTQSKGRGDSFVDDVYYKMGIDEAGKIIEEIYSYSSANDFSISFVFMPIRGYSEQMQQIKIIVKNNNIKYIDLNYTLTKLHGKKHKKNIIFPNDNCHLNVKGHIAVSEMVRSNLNRLID